MTVAASSCGRDVLEHPAVAPDGRSQRLADHRVAYFRHDQPRSIRPCRTGPSAFCLTPCATAVLGWAGAHAAWRRVRRRGARYGNRSRWQAGPRAGSYRAGLTRALGDRTFSQSRGGVSASRGTSPCPPCPRRCRPGVEAGDDGPGGGSRGAGIRRERLCGHPSPGRRRGLRADAGGDRDAHCRGVRRRSGHHRRRHPASGFGQPARLDPTRPRRLRPAVREHRREPLPSGPRPASRRGDDVGRGRREVG